MEVPTRRKRRIQFKFKQNILFDVYVTYCVFILIGFIGTIIYYGITRYFCYLTGWIFPVPFVMFGLYLQITLPDILLKKAKEYGEHATKPRGFMALSTTLHILSYVVFIIPFLIMWGVSVNYGVSLLSLNGWFNIYCAISSTFLLLILLFIVKLTREYFIRKHKKDIGL